MQDHSKADVAFPYVRIPSILDRDRIPGHKGAAGQPLLQRPFRHVPSDIIKSQLIGFQAADAGWLSRLNHRQAPVLQCVHGE